MSKKVKFWVARPLKGGDNKIKRTLKGICEETGIKYATAKSACAFNTGLKEGDKRIYVVGEQAWEVWTEMIG